MIDPDAWAAEMDETEEYFKQIDDIYITKKVHNQTHNWLSNVSFPNHSPLMHNILDVDLKVVALVICELNPHAIISLIFSYNKHYFSIVVDKLLIII